MNCVTVLSRRWRQTEKKTSVNLSYYELIEIIEALDRRLPKVIDSYTLMDTSDHCSKSAMYRCPECGMIIDRDFQLHCTNCGQALNWKHCGYVQSLKRCKHIDGLASMSQERKRARMRTAVKQGKYELLRVLIGL